MTESGADRGAPGLLHGTTNHPDLHNPVTFTVNLPRRTRFDAIVGDVSGSGGAKMVLRLDGDTVMTRDFPDPDGTDKTETLTSFAGTYSLEIPAGRHTIRVENTGRDWMRASFRFRGALVQKTPALDAWAAVGEKTIVLWARNSGRPFARLMAEGESAGGTIPPTYAKLAGLASGTYDVTLWDTWEGKPIRTLERNVGLDGILTVALPAITHDLAVKAVLRP
ncbi:hypothetical protein EON77_04725 [bacterium]|nr:MAG: hypothetical protein EON77_04725 [bacterium]